MDNRSEFLNNVAQALGRPLRLEPQAEDAPLLEAIVLNDGGIKQQAIVQLLLEHGASPHLTDKYGKTPLELARERGFEEIAQLLIAAGA